MIKDYSALFLLLIIISIYSCNNNVEPTDKEVADLFQIHLQTWFSDTPVKVRVDYYQIFNDTITTGSIIAVASVIPFEIYKGTHILSVTVADSITSDTTFTINDTLYIGVNYSSTYSRIMYRFQRHPFGYR